MLISASATSGAKSCRWSLRGNTHAPSITYDPPWDEGGDIANEYVEAAIEECDSLGRAVFAKKYGFGESSRYPLLYDGREYDSKAIVGRAYALAHPGEGLKAWTAGLSGGLRPGDAVYLLEEKGYEIDDRSSAGGPRRG